MGSRGAFSFNLDLDLRVGAHHSGNWGGLISIPASSWPTPSLAWSTATAGSVDALRPRPRNSVRMALADCTVEGGSGPAVGRNGASRA